MEKQVVLITGGATGLGKEIVLELSRQGLYRVYSTSRKDVTESIAGVHWLRMDVSSDESVQRALDEILAQTGHIDVVINNAGVTLAGPTLNFSPEDCRNLFEINVLGGFRVLKHLQIRSCWPRLVVNITSLNGFFSFPNFGLYSASKFAAEALWTALRHELGPDTQVVNVAPGALVSDLSNKMPHQSARQKMWIIRALMPLTPQTVVAQKIASILRRRRVPLHVRIGRDAWIIHMMQRILPESLLDWIISFVWKKH